MQPIKLKFIFEGSFEIINAEKEEFMNDIFKRYANKINKSLKEIYFLYSGSLITPEKKLKDVAEYILNQENIEKILKDIELIFLVDEYPDDTDKEDIFKQSKDIICPMCKEACLINFNDYKITFNKCKNGHCFSNILIDEFNDFQKINES